MMQERVAIGRILFPCPTTSNFEVVEEEEEVIETQLNTVRSYLHFQQYLWSLIGSRRNNLYLVIDRYDGFQNQAPEAGNCCHGVGGLG